MAFYARHTGFRPLRLFNTGQQSMELARIPWCYDQNNVVLLRTQSGQQSLQVSLQAAIPLE